MTTKLRAPFPYFGGKYRASALINKRLGAVDTYIEPFGGTLAVLLTRDPSRREIVNDLDGFICNFWRAAQAAPDEWARAAARPTNHSDLIAARKWLAKRRLGLNERIQADLDYYDARVAGIWAWVVSCQIGALSFPTAVHGGIPMTGHGDGRGISAQNSAHRGIPLTRSPGGRGINAQRITGMRDIPVNNGSKSKLMAQGCFDPQNPSAHILPIANALQSRLWQVIIHSRDWQKFCSPSLFGLTQSGANDATTGILLDPPYAPDNRAGGASYTYDSADVAADVRRWAIDVAAEYGDRVRIAFCSYEGDFGGMAEGWWAESWGKSGRRKKADRKREVVWFSPGCLTDVQAVGGRQEGLF